jgi:glucose/arabinose dehydrogenase
MILLASLACAQAAEVEVRTLIEAHFSALNAAVYDRDAFPAEYRGDAFVALHGFHSRPERTKMIRVLMKDGTPAGEYEDFMTGFLEDNNVSGAVPLDWRASGTALCW